MNASTTNVGTNENRRATPDPTRRGDHGAVPNPEAVYLSRQPIYDRKLGLYGYELLYRSSVSNFARFQDADRATAQVIHNTIELGLDQVIGDEIAFINLTPNFILDAFCLSLPRDRVVLEVDEAVLETPEVREQLLALHRQGFRIAVDEFTQRREIETIVALQATVKIDITSSAQEDLLHAVSAFEGRNVRLLAKKVETQEDLDRCRDLGFHFFQGYFFCKPRLMKGRQIPLNRFSAVRLIARLQDPAIEAEELEGLISQDVTLSYKLLRFVNSAYCGMPRQVESISHATVMVGIDRLRVWSSLLMLGSVEDKPRELVVTAAVRARMCEELARATGVHDVASYFTVGLLSVLDAMLDSRMTDVVRRLPLSELISEALLSHRYRHGQILALVIAWEQDNEPLLGELCRQLDLSAPTVRQAYLNAIDWSGDVKRELSA